MEKMPLEKRKKIATAIATTIFTLVIGEVIGLVLVFIGIAFCVTIIGAIIGIPILLFGLLVMIISPFGGIGVLLMHKGLCPHCKNELTYNGEKALTCRYCHTRLLVKENKLVEA